VSATLAEVVAALEQLYPTALAESWDTVGLVCGDPAERVDKVLFAVDPVEEVAQQALAEGCQLLVTHHPLYLGGTDSVAADDPKGRVVHALVRGGCGLLVAHTNADKASPHGVNDALAARFGLLAPTPLDVEREPLDKLVFFVPVADAGKVTDAVTAAGAGRLGAYDECTWSTPGTGTFRPLEGAQPAVGQLGRRESVEEVRVETVVRRGARDAVVQALLAAHPYETPAYDVIEVAPVPTAHGLGRVGDLPSPMALQQLVVTAREVLPARVVRGVGDPGQVVRRLAVVGGAGDDMMAAAVRAGADALLTADLRHHKAAERPEGLALVDAGHFATEHPWLSLAADALARVVDVEVSVSEAVTDPFF
jgi:dinuclear metal center YbgI/SA1388 family protein